MKKLIVEIEEGSRVRDDDYRLYSDGSVVHYYDRNQWDMNNEWEYAPDKVPVEIQEKFLNYVKTDKCTPEVEKKIIEASKHWQPKE